MIKRFLKEQLSRAALQASSMGLEYSGFGLYKDKETGKITHMTRDGQLVPIAKSHDKKEQTGSLVTSNPDQSFDKEGRVASHVKQFANLQTKVDKEINDYFDSEEEEVEKIFNKLLKQQTNNLGGDTIALTSSSRAIRIAFGEYFGPASKILNCFAAKQNVDKYDTGGGKYPLRPVGSIDSEKKEYVEQNYSNLIRTLDKLIDKNELVVPVMTYRGLSTENTEKLCAEYENGSTIINLPAFASVTLDKNVAMDFADGGELILFLPAGTKAIVVEPSAEKNEKEIILARNSKIRIDKIEEHGEEQKVITATLIAQ